MHSTISTQALPLHRSATVFGSSRALRNDAFDGIDARSTVERRRQMPATGTRSSRGTLNVTRETPLFYAGAGWTVLRHWEHEWPEGVALSITDVVQSLN